jgi:gamma-glutamyltranspeptidase/glutathione hydrolase
MSLPLAPFGPRTGLRGMVAAADQLAAAAGLGMLDRGGSAADAAVATGTAMAVVGPHLCGLGGDVLAVVAPPGSPPEALLSVGRAGAGSDPERMRRDGLTTMPLRGDIRSVQVPGAVDGWLALHERYGRLPLHDVLAPAVELAEEGFPASIMLALASHLVHALPGAGELCPDGPLAIGQTVRLPGIARTLRAIALHGRAGFYDGEFGRGLLDLGDGHFAPSDLATSAAAWSTPLRANAWGHDLWTVPPPSQGYLTLAGAVVAQAAGLGSDPDDPQWAHLLVETWRAVGHDRPAMLFDGADGDALLHPERLAAAAARVHATDVAPSDVAPGTDTPTGTGPPGADVPRLGDGDTTHLCAQDADGLGISLTQSNALDFGSHLVEPTTGVFLHNRGVGFSLVPGHPAEVAPGRRPPHTLSPMLVTDNDGALTHLVGAMGGDAQPQIIVQLLARLLLAGQNPATAITAPRLTLDARSAGPFRLWWGEDLTVLVEADAPPAWRAGLTRQGHRVRTIGAFDPVAVGCAQIIQTQRESTGARLLVGASDPRSPAGAALAR